MVRHIIPVSALLLGLFFLLFAGGINGLILPVRGAAEGFSAFALGLLGTGWAIGYVAGCISTARLVSRAGHIRAFSVMASLAAISILAQLLLIDPRAWIPLRAAQGFCFAGAAMIVESWLSEQSDPSQRGRVFGAYTMVNLVGSTAGQLLLITGDTSGYLFFVIGAIFYCLSLLPTAAFSTTSPRPLASVSLNLPALWRNSPLAVVAVTLVGVSNGAFGTLSAVYASRIGLPLTSIAIFASIPALAGALAQLPVGILSDRVDRRKILIGLSLLALISDLCFIALRPQDALANLIIVSVLGAAIYSMYPVIVAHANDHGTGEFIQISGGLLMLFGVGSIIGPLFAGAAMSLVSETGLFLTTALGHVLMISYAIWRIGRRPDVKAEEKSDFLSSPTARVTTPEMILLQADALGLSEDDDPRTQGDTPGETQEAPPQP